MQRRHQKLVEVAPSPSLDAGMRARLAQAAITLALAIITGLLMPTIFSTLSRAMRWKPSP